MATLDCLLFTFLSYILVTIGSCGEYCTYTDNNGYSRYIYCDGYCCSSEEDHCCANYIGLIVGCVIGGVILIAVAITIVVIVCKKHNMKKGRVLQQPRQTTTTTTTTHHSNIMYNNQYMAPPQPPPYSYANPYQPQYVGVAGPSYPPPPAYPGPPLKNGNSTYTDQQVVSRPISVNVQLASQGQSDPAYPPPSS